MIRTCIFLAVILFVVPASELSFLITYTSFESVSFQLRTIFIAGLPDDVKERELLNLLRWLPGYEASQVNFKGEKPMGFALFSTAQSAMAAKDALQVCLLITPHFLFTF